MLAELQDLEQQATMVVNLVLIGNKSLDAADSYPFH